ncbi:MAG: hypothetical protein ACPG1C_02280 [Alphaproteobacteria bacterium]
MRLVDPFVPLPFVIEADRIVTEIQTNVAAQRWQAGNDDGGCAILPLVTTHDPTGPQAGIAMQAGPELATLPTLRTALSGIEAPMGLCDLVQLEAGASLETEAQITPYSADRLLLLLALQPLSAAMLGHTHEMPAGAVYAVDTSRAACFENIGERGPAAILLHTFGTAYLWNAVETPGGKSPHLLTSKSNAPLRLETGGRRLQTADVIDRHRRRLIADLPDNPIRRRTDILTRDLARDWRALEATFQPNDVAALAPFARRLNQFENDLGDKAFDLPLINSGRPVRDALAGLATFMMNPDERARFPQMATPRPAEQTAQPPVFVLGTRQSPAQQLYDLLASAPELSAMTPQNRNMLSAAPVLAGQSGDNDDIKAARLIEQLGVGRAVHQSVTAMQQIDLLNHAFPEALFVLCWATPLPEDADRFTHAYKIALEGLERVGRDRTFILSSLTPDTLQQLYAFLAIAPVTAWPPQSTPPSTQPPPKAEPMIQRLRLAMDAQPDWQPAP